MFVENYAKQYGGSRTDSIRKWLDKLIADGIRGLPVSASVDEPKLVPGEAAVSAKSTVLSVPDTAIAISGARKRHSGDSAPAAGAPR